MGSYTPTIKHRHEHGHNVCKNKQISVKKKDVWIRKKIKSDNNLVQQNNTAFALNTFELVYFVGVFLNSLSKKICDV